MSIVRDDPEPSEPRPGIAIYTPDEGCTRRHAMVDHDHALAQGFESEFREFRNPRVWEVVIAQPGESLPPSLPAHLSPDGEHTGHPGRP